MAHRGPGLQVNVLGSCFIVPPCSSFVHGRARRRWARVDLTGLAVLLLFGVVLSGCFGGPSEQGGDAYDVTVRTTSFGVRHVEAEDWGSLGYGYGFVAAQDYLCMIAEEYVTVAGERSRFFGPDGGYSLTSNGQSYTNRESDLFFTLLREHPELVDSSADRDLPEVQAVLEGYIAGYNTYLQQTPDEELPEDCRGEPWVRPITREDMVGRVNKLQLIGSSGFFAPAMVAAEPPLAGLPVLEEAAHAQGVSGQELSSRLPTPETMGIGSNAYGFGADMTHNGRGLLMGNPHFPWDGPERFHMVHLRIPGELDVMGMTLLGVPLVLIGFNEAVAWSHTVSTGWRFSLHELTLVPGDPTAYVVDGEIERMTTKTVSVEGEEHTFYFSRYGPVISFPVESVQLGGVSVPVGLTWNLDRAYALQDQNARNNRIAEQFLRMAQTQDLGSFMESLQEVHGVPWVNTVATDREGDVFYGDLSIVPDYEAEDIERCNTVIGRALFEAARLPVFDGSRSECDVNRDPAAVQPGALPAHRMPSVTSKDWLMNSNDAHWLPNPEYPLEGHSPMIGEERGEQSLRTRMGFMMWQEHEAGVSGSCGVDPEVPCELLTPQRLWQGLYSSRLLAAEMELDNVIEGVCGSPVAVVLDAGVVDLSEACQVLAAWDRRAGVGSAGLALFELFWQRVPKTWTVPFDPEDPVGTPRGMVTEDPRVREALGEAVRLMEGAGLPLDSTAMEARFVERDGQRVPLHGADGGLGSPSMLVMPFEPGTGFLEPVHGNSYIQVVSWDDEGRVVPTAVLTYSQSPHEDSSHRYDQTMLYSQGSWLRLPFAEHEIQGDPELTAVRLRS
jgi:acyl-homoserine-lactone acylase